MRLQTRFHWSPWVLLAVLSGAFFFVAPQQSAAEFAPELQQALDSSQICLYPVRAQERRVRLKGRNLVFPT